MNVVKLIGRAVRKTSETLHPGSTRAKKAFGKRMGESAERFVGDSTPLAVAIAVNFGVVVALGSVVAVRAVKTDEPDFVGFLMSPEPTQPPAPPAGAGLPQVDVSVAAMSASAPAVETDIAAVTSTASTPSSFAFGAPAPAIPDAGAMAEAMQSLRANSGRGQSGEGEGAAPAVNASIGGKGEGKAPTAGGMKVVAQRLGVILEQSPATRRLMPKLVEEIQRSFPRSFCASVVNCEIEMPRGETFESLLGKAARGKSHANSLAMQINEPNTLTAILTLVEVDRVDAIIWYSDIHFNQDPTVMAQIKDYLIGKNVRFYLRIAGSDTMVKEPMKRLVEETGGEMLDEIEVGRRRWEERQNR